MKSFSCFFSDCEESFVGRLTISLTFKYFKHLELMQAANSESIEIYFVWEGGVAIYEPSCYMEPILVYRRGAVLNTYQVLMDQTLELPFRAISPAKTTSIVKPTDSTEMYFESKAFQRPLNKSRHSFMKSSVEIMSISRDVFLEACEKFPESAKVV